MLGGPAFSGVELSEGKERLSKCVAGRAEEHQIKEGMKDGGKAMIKCAEKQKSARDEVELIKESSAISRVELSEELEERVNKNDVEDKVMQNKMENAEADEVIGEM